MRVKRDAEKESKLSKLQIVLTATTKVPKTLRNFASEVSKMLITYQLVLYFRDHQYLILFCSSSVISK